MPGLKTVFWRSARFQSDALGIDPQAQMDFNNAKL
jgi:hypothetical protein